MVDNLYREIVKITLVGENNTERQKIKDVFTKKIQVRSAVISNKTGSHDFGSKYFSKDDEEFFEKCGFKVKINERIRRIGVNTVAGMAAVVRAKNLKDYNTGCVISVVCSGETPERLQNAKDNAEFKIMNLLNINGIPASRMCIESNLACVYKFR